MLEFKLQYYFEKYKDTCIISTALFKVVFTKKEGEFELLPELVNMIQKYQYNKYGNLLTSGKKTYRLVKKGTYGMLENQRMNNRFGSKEERLKRKLEDKRNERNI